MKSEFLKACLKNSLNNVTIANPDYQDSNDDGILLCHITSRTGGGEVSVLKLFALAKEYYPEISILGYIRARSNHAAVERIERFNSINIHPRVIYFGSRSLEEELKSNKAESARSLLSTPAELSEYEQTRSVAEIAISEKKREMLDLVKKHFPDQKHTRQARLHFPVIDRSISKRFAELPDDAKARVLLSIGAQLENAIAAELGGNN